LRPDATGKPLAMDRMLRGAAAAFAALLALAGAAAALAATDGQFDVDGHPNVGALVYRESDGSYRLLCSGSLISSKVVLTAARCTSDLAGRGVGDVWVTFNSTFDARSSLLHGTIPFNQAGSNPGGIAVVVLDSPVDITPVRLPTSGLLDKLKRTGTLNRKRFASVGYGVQQPNNGLDAQTYPVTSQRWVSNGHFSALRNGALRLSQSRSGSGVTCYGDSGGPQFLGGGSTETQVSVTAAGDAVCRETIVGYRIDTPAARAFLGEYVTLP
jgi:hypothetical protein